MKIIGQGLAGMVVLILLIVLIPVACKSPDTARKTLEDNGYANVQITGYRWFACDEKDTFSTGFKATTPTGKQVSGAVCSGFFKGNTIRFD